VTPLLSSLVHYGINYNNAFWNGYNMTYGDGDGVTFTPLVSLDVTGHEMTHCVTERTANLIYSGESGALNESMSDVFGAMTKRFVRGESASTWLNGDEIYTPGVSGDAGRYMDSPHRASEKGFTADDDPDHYSERYLGSADNGGVHINSGIANKAFYLVAKGGAHHLGGSMSGIGADRAAQIWFRALTSYMTSSTDFAGARTATLNAATALYGGTSREFYAVAAAWCMVGVGSCGVPATVSATPAIGTGSAQTFAFQYSDSVGGGNVATAWIWIAPSSTGPSANSCLLNYDRVSGVLQLLNDAGTTWSTASPGSGITLQNSQCAIDAQHSSVIAAGTMLTVNVPLTFKPTYTGAKNLYMFAVNSSGASTGWQDRGDWAATAPSVVTVDSVTPNAGTGPSQTFTMRYSDTAGGANLTDTWVWFDDAFGSLASSCAIRYDVPTNALFLWTDAGVATTSATLGAPGTLENSQCAIALGASSTTTLGNSRTLSLAMTFKQAFNGPKMIAMLASNGATDSGGFQSMGSWTVVTAVATVTADGVTPGTGTGTTQTFALQYSDSAGAGDLTQAWVWFNASMATAASSCLAYFDRSSNNLLLLNDAGTAWMSAAIGSGVTLQNGQCALAASGSSTTTAGTTRTLNLAVTFKPAFAGAKHIYMYGTNGSASSGWQDRGDWQVTAGSVATVTADSATPVAGVGASQTFGLQYSDSTGASHLSQAWTWFTASMASAVNSCLAYYDQPGNLLFLLNDAGTAWLSAAPGSPVTLQNQQCAIDVATSGASTSGNALTLSLALTFKPAFVGVKKVYLFASNGIQTSGWQARGDWVVPNAAQVTAGAVTPGTGTGSTQTFALQYLDTTGAGNLKQTWVWFNASMASAANSCLAYYDQSLHLLFLLNDTGSAWLSATPGSPTTLQNQQCAIDVAASSRSTAGNDLTLTLPITFAPGFAGPKNIYLFASNGTSTSNWQDRGDWTVP
jgi:hypothetical protein